MSAHAYSLSAQRRRQLEAEQAASPYSTVEKVGGRCWGGQGAGGAGNAPAGDALRNSNSGLLPCSRAHGRRMEQGVK